MKSGSKHQKVAPRMNPVYSSLMSDLLTRTILHCPECGRELLSQSACDQLRAQLDSENPENPIEEMRVFCEGCSKLQDVVELAKREKYLT